MKSNRKLLLENEFDQLASAYQAGRKENLPALEEAEEKEAALVNTEYTGYNVGLYADNDSLRNAQKTFGYETTFDDTLPGEIAEKQRLKRNLLDAQRLARKSFLEKKSRYDDDYIQLFPPVNETSLSKRLRRLFKIKQLFKIAEKLVMGIDDVPAAAARMLEKAGPFLLSGAGFFVFTSKIVGGIKEFDKAFNNTELSPTERYTELATSLLQVTLGMAGLAVSGYILGAAAFELLSSLVHVIEVVQAATPALSVILHPLAVGFAPLGVPAILSTIAAIELYQASSSFHFAKQNESLAKAQYEKTLTEETAKLNVLNDKRLKFEKKKNALLKALEEETIDKEIALEAIKRLNNKLAEIDTAYFASRNIVDKSKKAYEDAHKGRVKAERELGFASTEMILSLVVLTLFTMTVLTTTGVFSFGAVPGFVLLGVVGTICAVKLFEVVDKIVFDSKGTTAIRNFAINTANKIKSAASDLWKKCTNFFSPGPGPGPAPDAPVLMASEGMGTLGIHKGMKATTPSMAVLKRKPTISGVAESITSGPEGKATYAPIVPLAIRDTGGDKGKEKYSGPDRDSSSTPSSLEEQENLAARRLVEEHQPEETAFSFGS